MEQEKPLLKSNFLIKISNETVQKLQEAPPPEPPSKALPSASDVESKEKPPEPSENFKKPSPSPATSVEDIGKSVSSTSTIKNDKQNSKQSDTASEGEDASGWGDYAPYVSYEGELAVYTDPTTKTQYTWNNDSTSWTPRNNESEQPSRTYSYENDTHVYTETDGSKFFWDEEKKAWFPKVDDDFLAHYQLAYGFVDNTTQVEKPKIEDKKMEEGGTLKRKAPEPPKWFDASDDKNNTKVYVSNLPEDMTEQEFIDFMQKCGLVMRDPSSQKMKIKLYMDKDNNCFKGDALCTYIKIESVDLALKLLDGSDIRGHKISVQRAQFQMKGDYNPALKPKKKKKKELEKIKRMQEKLFDWRPEKAAGERSKNERVVIVKNLFDPTDFDKEVQLILDYQQDLREECGKCGEVRKVILYDRHPEGVAQITMKEPEHANAVVTLINGRWFGKRKLSAEIWDGKTKYKIAETDADMSTRVNKWEKFLEGAEGDKPGKEEEKKDSSSAEKSEESTKCAAGASVVSDETAGGENKDKMDTAAVSS